MKQYKPLIYVLMALCGAIMFAGCDTVTANKTDKAIADKIEDASFEVKPTAEADPSLKGSEWKCDPVDGFRYSIWFAENGNLANIDYFGDALYTVTDKEVLFDLTEFAKNCKNLTGAQLAKLLQDSLEADIAKYEEKLKTRPDDKRTKTQLKEAKEELKNLKLMSAAKVKETYQDIYNAYRKTGENLEPYTKFTGVFNDLKKEMKINKFPVHGLDDGTVKTSEAVFKKK